jgi:hypothetical protein
MMLQIQVKSLPYRFPMKPSRETRDNLKMHFTQSSQSKHAEIAKFFIVSDALLFALFAADLRGLCACLPEPGVGR